jgi:Icc-related predicted phosphoesterase
MTTRIGLISDVHSSPGPLTQALEIFRKEQVDEIICAGDIAGYYDTLLPTIELLAESNCKVSATTINPTSKRNARKTIHRFVPTCRTCPSSWTSKLNRNDCLWFTQTLLASSTVE